MNAAVIVPNWNGLAFLRTCIASLEDQSNHAHMIVVDNGSTDGSLTWLRGQHPGVEVVALPGNAGFAGGVNRGIELALRRGADFVALLNNDAVADRGWLEALRVAADAHPDAGMVTGKLLTADGQRIDSTGNLYSVWGFPFPRGRGEDAGNYTAGEYVFAATGGACLLRAAMLRQIGVFDERYFAYYEDVDLSFRCQLAGWRVWYEPTAIARHVIGGTTSRHPGFARYHATKNFVFLYCKNMPAGLFWKYAPRFVAAFMLNAGSAIRRGEAGALIRGWVTIAQHLSGVRADRARIKAGTGVADEYIDALLYKHMPPTQRTLHSVSCRLGRIYSRSAMKGSSPSAE